MKCQNPKCKNTKLETKRTYENGLSTTREKFCPKCHERPMTIELMQAELDKIHNDHKAEVKTLKQKIQLNEDKLSEIKHSIVSVLEFAAEKKQEVRKHR
jgi:transcriptional regulator NrdR family protein